MCTDVETKSLWGDGRLCCCLRTGGWDVYSSSSSVNIRWDQRGYTWENLDCFWYKEKCLTIALHHFQRLGDPGCGWAEEQQIHAGGGGSSGRQGGLFLSSVSCPVSSGTAPALVRFWRGWVNVTSRAALRQRPPMLMGSLLWSHCAGGRGVPRIPVSVRASRVRRSNSAKKWGWERVLTVRRVNIIFGRDKQERRRQYLVWASWVGKSEVISEIFSSFKL